jgi:hypothetical protein
MCSIGFIGAARSTEARCSIFYQALACITLLLSTLLRHDAVFAAAPLVLLLVFLSPDLPGERIGSRLWAATLRATPIVCIIVVASALITNSLVSIKTHPWKSVALLDIAGIIVQTKDQDQQNNIYKSVPASIRGPGSLDNLPANFSPRYWGTLVRPAVPVFGQDTASVTDREWNNLFQAWLSAAAHSPVLWLQHRTAVFQELLGLSSSDLFAPVIMEPNAFPYDNSGVINNPPLTAFQGHIRQALYYLLWHHPFRPWTYLVLSILLLFVCAFRPTPHKAAIALIVLSGVLHELSLFFLAPSADFRYSHYMIYTSLLSLCLYLDAHRRKQTSQ